MRDDRRISTALGFNRYLVDNIYEMGNQRLMDDEIAKAQTASKKRLERRRDVNAAMEKLHWDEKEADSVVEKTDGADAPWSSVIQKLTPAYYT